MNKTEQAKVRALAECQVWGDFDSEFQRGLAWCVEHSPEVNLTPKQKYLLDLMLWRYRKQAAGKAFGFEMPELPPEETDYLPFYEIPAQGELI